MPIHGHTKIELTSQTTGEVETIEKDNIVTNAVSQIFNAFNGMALLREANANGEYGSTSDKSWDHYCKGFLNRYRKFIKACDYRWVIY